MEKIKFSADAAYPEIKVLAPDVKFAKKLLFAYSSKDSELTATAGYSYKSVILARKDNELSQIMSGIARVEMLHQNILAKLIWLLGYDPKYRIVEKDAPIYWNGDFVSYKKDIASILKDSITEEKNAYDGYITLSRTTNDPNVKKILLRIAIDEKLHAEILTKELQKRTK